MILSAFDSIDWECYAGCEVSELLPVPLIGGDALNRTWVLDVNGVMVLNEDGNRCWMLSSDLTLILRDWIKGLGEDQATLMTGDDLVARGFIQMDC